MAAATGQLALSNQIGYNNSGVIGQATAGFGGKRPECLLVMGGASGLDGRRVRWIIRSV
jgi:hypothetical protein